MSITACLVLHDPPMLCAGVSKPDEEPAAIPVTLQYLNEGGANIVFRISRQFGNAALPTQLQGRLLRLRKDLKHVRSAAEQLAAFNEHFKPLFPIENLVQQEPLAIHKHLLAAINDVLRGLDRPARRQNDILPVDETHGTLLTDMTPARDEVLLQIKPKWLSQSPNAPTGAKRCRTCALRARRAAQQLRTATDAQGSCPLALVSEEADRRLEAAKSVTDNGFIQQYLAKDAQSLLHVLSHNQQKLDSMGVLNATTDEEIQSLCKAMTLRDCTLFLKLSTGTIDAKLADLDLKQSDKLEQWREVERTLIGEGWYANEETPEVWREEDVCLLSQLSDLGNIPGPG